MGSAAVKCPEIDIGPAFSAAANAALGTTLEPAFSPYADYIKFLHGALLFEDVGVMAYNGAIGVIRSPGKHLYYIAFYNWLLRFQPRTQDRGICTRLLSPLSPLNRYLIPFENNLVWVSTWRM